MPRLLHHCLLAICCVLPMPADAARAGADAYALDPVHTRILVAVDHAGFSKALGTLSGATGTLWFDPGDWSSARIEVEIPLARLDFGDEQWNSATLARNLLDAGAHPLARFASTRIEPLDERRALVHGTLNLRGVEREVALEVVLNAAKRHPLPPFRRTLGFSATATLSRADFGIDAWKSLIGDTVELRIEAEATRTRGDDGAEAENGEAAPADATPEPAGPPDPDPDPDPDSDPVPDPVPASESQPQPQPESESEPSPPPEPEPTP